MRKQTVRVGLVLYSSNFFGGGNKFASDLSSGLIENGFDVAACAWDKPVKGMAHEEFLNIDRWYTPSIRWNVGKLYRIIFNEHGTVKKMIDDFEPDVLIGADTEPGVLAGHKVKKIMYVHFPSEGKVFKHSLEHELYRSLYWWRHYKAISELDAIVCNSEYTKHITYLLWKSSQPNKNRYSVIYPCVNVQRFAGELKRELKACYVGRIDRNKGLEELIHAFTNIKEEIKEAQLDIVGGVKGSPWAEEYYPVLLSKIQGLQGINIKTDVPGQEIVKTLLTSRCMGSFNPEEHFGIVPVEAMAAGCPPVCADGGGQKETIIDGETGFLVKNVEELTDRMSRLLSDDRLLKRMSKKAKDRAMLFDKKAFIEKWIKLLDSM